MIKQCCLVLLGFALTSASFADVEKHRAEETGKFYKEFETVAGRVYREVRITNIDDAGISITHADGLARLRFEHLKPEHRNHFGISKEGSAAVYAKENSEQAAFEAKVKAQAEEQEKAKREFIAKQTAAMHEAQLLAAEIAQRQQKQIAATQIESSLEIPAFPTIKGSDSGVFYGSRRYSPTRSTYYYGGGGYVYPSSYGYHPGHYHSYNPHGTRCAPTQRGSIFHFTIK
jgi:hypothetical protein